MADMIGSTPHSSVSSVRLHIFGASGSGTTTLGAALAAAQGWLHLDADDFYWKQGVLPFSEKVPQPERVSQLLRAMQGHGDWIISGGSLYSWAEPVVPMFTHAVFLRLDDSLRMQRIHARERSRFGDALDTDAERKRISSAFFEWAAGYETGGDRLRSLQRHQQWAAELHCPVLQFDTAQPLNALVGAVQRFLQK